MSSQYVLGRLAQSVPTVIGIGILIFLLLAVLPGNPADYIQAESGSIDPDLSRLLIQRWGLDRPVPERLTSWLLAVARLDFGESLYTGQPVLPTILGRLMNSLYLGFFAVGLGVAIGIPIGVLSASRPNSVADYGVMLAALGFISIPIFWLAMVFQLFFGLRLGLFPISGMSGAPFTPVSLLHVALPALTVALRLGAVNARIVRASLLESIGADYTRTARSKGLRERVVLYGHALPNALLPVVTLFGLQFRLLIAGLLLVEVIFGWPGVARLFYEAVLRRDYPVVQGSVLVIAVGIYFVNLLVDLLYAHVDPRVRVGATRR